MAYTQADLELVQEAIRNFAQRGGVFHFEHEGTKRIYTSVADLIVLEKHIKSELGRLKTEGAKYLGPLRLHQVIVSKSV